MSTFGEKIKAIRLSKDMSQEDMAELLGTTKQQISRYETGQNSPRLDTVAYISKNLDIELSLLINDKFSVDDVLNSSYYINPDTQAIAQRIYEDKKLRLLFEAAEDVSPDDLMLVHDMLKALKKKEQHDD